MAETRLPLIRVRVGRPKLPPRIIEKTRSDGSRVFLVRAEILGKDRRKVVASYDEAKLLATQWSGDRLEEIQVRPTRLSAAELGGAEAMSQMLKNLDLDFVKATSWLMANYKKPAEIEWVAYP